MKKNSIKQMLGLLGVSAKPGMEAPETGNEEPSSAAGTEPVPAQASAAERLGRALLGALGGVEGVSEDELVDAVLGEWQPSAHGRGEAEKTAPARETDAAKLILENDGDEADSPFGETFPTPVPMKAGSGKAEPIDYTEMSAEQFNRLKKLLKKANADGRKIRL